MILHAKQNPFQAGPGIPSYTVCGKPPSASRPSCAGSVHAKNGKTLEELHAVIESRPKELTCTFNLGAADFYLSTSGKAAAARWAQAEGEWGGR